MTSSLILFVKISNWTFSYSTEYLLNPCCLQRGFYLCLDSNESDTSFSIYRKVCDTEAQKGKLKRKVFPVGTGLTIALFDKVSRRQAARRWGKCLPRRKEWAEFPLHILTDNTLLSRPPHVTENAQVAGNQLLTFEHAGVNIYPPKFCVLFCFFLPERLLKLKWIDATYWKT